MKQSREQRGTRASDGRGLKVWNRMGGAVWAEEPQAMSGCIKADQGRVSGPRAVRHAYLPISATMISYSSSLRRLELASQPANRPCLHEQ